MAKRASRSVKRSPSGSNKVARKASKKAGAKARKRRVIDPLPGRDPFEL
jgi:hypothetical protein